MMDALEAIVAGPDQRTFRLGAALPLSGVLGQAGPSALEAILLAGRDLQATRSKSDRPIEIVLVDAGAPPRAVADSVSHLSRAGIVDAFVGLHTSDVLEAIEQKSTGHPMSYVFTAGHESRPRPDGFFSSGESPDEMCQGVRRLIKGRQIENWAIIGSDYVWPRSVGKAARNVIRELGASVVFDRVVALGEVQAACHDLLEGLVASKAQGVVASLPGRELIMLLSALKASGLDRKIVVCSGTLEENVLYALGGNSTGNLYATQHSFDNLRSPGRLELNERYTAAYGHDAPALNSWAEHCYDAVHLLVGLERNGLLAPSNLRMDEATTPAEVLRLRPRYEIQVAVAAGLSFEAM